MAERYERCSMLITSNLVFSQWDRIFKNPMATAAAIDRLVHHAIILEFDVPSYRTEDAKKRSASKPVGAWVYTGNSYGENAMTVGNSILAGPDALARKNFCGPELCQTTGKHAGAHITQGYVLGILYGPVHALSLLTGGTIGALSEIGFGAGTHTYDVCERWAIDVPSW